MKKVVLLIVSTIVISFKVQGQQNIPDGGFENCWVEGSSSKGKYWTFEDDYFFTTLNVIYTLVPPFGNGPLTAFRETADAYQGDYCVKLVSDVMEFGEDIFLPGAIGTLEIDILGFDFVLGEPFTSRPDILKGYHKYLPVNGDSAAIEIWLQKGNGTVLGRGKQVIKNAVPDWSVFNVPITYTSNDTPEEIVVIFAASGNYDFTSIETLMQCKGQQGSTLYLDEIELEYTPAGVKELFDPDIKLSIYPNPSTEQLNLQIGKETKGTVILYDYLIRKIGEYPIHGTQIDIDIRDYATGSYLINIVENDRVITTGRFVKE